MKVAIAKEGNDVAQHFGHCEGFEIFEIEGKLLKGSTFVENPGHKPGFLPNYLNDLGVNVVIAGGMGGGAIAIFNQHKIEVITGATGNIETIINKYLNNDIKSAGSICNEHKHAGECGEHN